MKKISLLLLTLALFVAYTNFITPVPWPHLVAKRCGDVVGAEVCRATYTWYFWLYAGLCLGYLWLAVREFIRPTILLLLGLGLFAVVQPFTFNELSHIQTYTYEAFIVGFYNWIAWLAMAFFACFLWPARRKAIIKSTAVLTLVMTLVFAFHGRGSIEHINPLVGGLLKEFSWEMAEQGMLIFVCLGIIAVTVAYNPLHNLGHWLLRGTADIAVWKRSAKLGGAFVAIALIPLLSLPIGELLHRQDVRSAKAYVDKLVPKLEAYHKQHNEYPDELTKIGVKVEEAPRLLDIYDYLAYGTKGGFYLARPEKYCFIFPDHSLKPGYWSLTSMRPWRISRPDTSLEESYEDVCDESEEDFQQQLIAGHLGLPDPNDPVTALGVAGGQPIPMQRQTQAVTPRLQQAIDELGYKHPDIYYQPPQLPKDAQVSPEQLLEELKKQPLRQD